MCVSELARCSAGPHKVAKGQVQKRSGVEGELKELGLTGNSVGWREWHTNKLGACLFAASSKVPFYR